MTNASLTYSTLFARLLGLAATSALCTLMVSHAAFAGPTGGSVAAGIAVITAPTSSQTLITQVTNKAVIDWTGFNTTAGQSVQFVQPSASSIALNRISGGTTHFDGSLLANGKVWLINGDGMLFGNATINTGSLLLSAAGIPNATGSGFFTNGTNHYSFSSSGNPAASITLNNTSVTTSPNSGGNTIIIQAPGVAVQNLSHLNAPGGHVALLAGGTFTADFFGDGLINFQLITTPTSAAVAGANSSVYVGGASTINAGIVVAEASVFQDAVLDHVINLGGQFEGVYNQATNPEQVVINSRPIVFKSISARPPVTPPSAPAPAAAAPAATLPSNSEASNLIDPLTRPLTSLSNETVNDTSVNPAVANVTYARPYLVSLPVSVAEGKLSLSAANNVATSPTNLGNLSPAAGGNAVDEDNLGNLSPAAGGTRGSVPSGTSCANSYLDNAWLNDPGLRSCVQ